MTIIIIIVSSSSFVYHRIILSTRFVGGMLSSMAKFFMFQAEEKRSLKKSNQGWIAKHSESILRGQTHA